MNLSQSYLMFTICFHICYEFSCFFPSHLDGIFHGWFFISYFPKTDFISFLSGTKIWISFESFERRKIIFFSLSCCVNPRRFVGDDREPVTILIVKKLNVISRFNLKTWKIFLLTRNSCFSSLWLSPVWIKKSMIHEILFHSFLPPKSSSKHFMLKTH